ncbi:macrolide ABC transporter ATP-binding protein [Candidatus Micrarchaeota archaeon CG10_big_fil_rev_8_21_14_0_10_45_29]|nr:MAG: macrolide ABC transporter ATP-binding protein [Candidatus Micrarchaeota archaeon CG10_big_fil_rev_8_21_14_0_10_45_29]
MAKKGNIVLEMSGIRKAYQMGMVTVDALQGVDLVVHEGERLSITGPSGSGKSTLLHILGLLDRPSEGLMRIGGTDISTLSDNQLSYFRGKKIGFIFQAFHLVPSLSALGNVALPMMFYDVPREQREKRATEALESLGMGDRLHHLPSELSGGQRQRVAIARSLVNDPSILLADEPTGNLDSKSGEEVLKVFDDLHKDGRTLIVVTHDAHIANKSPRQVKLRDGRIVSDTGKKHL